jgi:hypothetical protein
MTSDVRKALTAIDCTYDDLVEVANEIFNTTTKEVDGMMTDAYNDIEKMSNDAIRDLMLKLSLKSYTFSEVKEKSAFKSTMGEILRKEAYAKNFNSIEGTVAVRETNATIQTSGEIIAEEIYTLVANMLKTKLDEIHRVVNTLQTVLMTRIQEAKLTTVDIQ